MELYMCVFVYEINKRDGTIYMCVRNLLTN